MTPDRDDGPIALVTGSRHRIGRAIAQRLRSQGYRIAWHGREHGREGAQDGNVRDEDGRDEVAQSVPPISAQHTTVPDFVFAADLDDPHAAETLVGRVAAHFGALPSLIVNNAARFAAESDDDADTLLAYHRVNALAPILLTLAFARLGGRGGVVNILDQRIRNPNRDQLAYTLAKGALAAATRPLAVRLAPHVRVNAVAPGFTLANPEHDRDQQTRIRLAMPLRALSEPDDIAEAVAYFAGAAHVTGQTLFVDGGASLRGFERDFLYF